LSPFWDILTTIIFGNHIVNKKGVALNEEQRQQWKIRITADKEL